MYCKQMTKANPLLHKGQTGGQLLAAVGVFAVLVYFYTKANEKQPDTARRI